MSHEHTDRAAEFERRLRESVLSVERPGGWLLNDFVAHAREVFTEMDHPLSEPSLHTTDTVSETTSVGTSQATSNDEAGSVGTWPPMHRNGCEGRCQVTPGAYPSCWTDEQITAVYEEARSLLTGVGAPSGQPQPDAPNIWDSSVPPGGYVCATCGTPTESEPCPDHQPNTTADMDREDSGQPQPGDRVRLTYGDGSGCEGTWELIDGTPAVRLDDGTLHEHVAGQVRRDIIRPEPQPGDTVRVTYWYGALGRSADLATVDRGGYYRGLPAVREGRATVEVVERAPEQPGGEQ